MLNNHLWSPDDKLLLSVHVHGSLCPAESRLGLSPICLHAFCILAQLGILVWGKAESGGEFTVDVGETQKSLTRIAHMEGGSGIGKLLLLGGVFNLGTGLSLRRPASDNERRMIYRCERFF